MNNKVKGFVAGVLAAVFYGTNPLGALPLYADGINSSTVLFYRYGLAALMFAVWLLLSGEGFCIKWGHAIRFSMLGAIFGMSSITLYVSFHYMDAGIASTILFSYPIMVAVLMAVVYHEHVSWRTAMAILLATVGIGMLYRGDGNAVLNSTGLTLVLLSSLLYAVYIIAIQRWQVEYSAVKFTFWIVFFGLLAIVAFSWVAGERLMWLRTTKEWACAFQLGLLPTVLSLWLMTVAIKHIGSTPSAILGALEPVTAVVIGVIIFGEVFTFRLAVGIVLILSGVTFIIIGGKKQAEEVVPAIATDADIRIGGEKE